MVWVRGGRSGFPYKGKYYARFYKGKENDYGGYYYKKINISKDTIITLRNVSLIDRFDKKNYYTYVATLYINVPKRQAVPLGDYSEIKLDVSRGYPWFVNGKLYKIKVKIEDYKQLYDLAKYAAFKKNGQNKGEKLYIELDELRKELIDKTYINNDQFEEMIQKLEKEGYIKIMEGTKDNRKIRIIFFEK